MPDRLIMIAVVVLLGALIAGCPRPDATDPAATAPVLQAPDAAGISGEVILYVPCGMIIPIRGVMDAFEQKYPQVKLRGEFDNAGVLVDRLAKKGEKADLFISPGSQEFKLLVDAGLAEAGTEKAVGDFELVIITNREAATPIAAAEDLRKIKTISMPDPALNSVGLSGQEALTNLGLWDELQPKIVKTKHAIVSHTLVAGGRSDAGISYRNCPLETNPEKLSTSKVQVAYAFPPGTYEKQQCLIAPVKGAPNPAAARAFVDFVTSEEGLKILDEKGMTGCLTLDNDTAGSAAVDTSKATVTVRAFYPDNEGHKQIKAMIQGLPARYEGRVAAEFVDFTSKAGFDKWREAGLSCGAILINDRQTWVVDKDGKPTEVTFKMAIDGEWTEADLYAVIDKALAETE